MAKRTACLRQLGGDRAGAVRFGRFLSNRKVTQDVMLSTAARHTARAAQGRHVLAIQDTTELNYSGHVGSKRGFGVVGNGQDIGLFLHPVIVLAAGSGDRRQVGYADGVLGLIDAFVSSRKQQPPGGRQSREAARRKPRPIAQKETGRWIDGLASVERELGGAAMATLIADRESDIYEEFATPRSAHVHLIVRAAHNRCLTDGDKLFAKMAALPGMAGQEIEIPAKPGQPGRQARTRISYASVEIGRGRWVYDRTLPERLTLQAIRVAEIDPPEGIKPVEWLLLTTHKVENLADARQIIGWYRARWAVEQVFRTMKTQGFDVEESQIETPEVLSKLAIAVLIAALRTLQLVYARSGTTGQELSDAMDEAAEPLVEALVAKLEGKTEKLKNPRPPKTLARLAWVVGRLGGWDGYVGHGYKPPGPKTMAAGLIQFDAIRVGWQMRRDV